jgi:hypothetical protein
MKKEFIPYEQALLLKKLRFNEPCVAIFCTNKELNIDDGFYKQEEYHKNTVLAPTFSQAFRWFREKYDCHHTIQHNKKYVGIAYSSVVNFSIDEFNTYEEAELECLKKLIEIVKNK